MTNRDLSLTPRKEFTREAKVIEPPTHFLLNEIHQHFVDSFNSIKAQFNVADQLLQEQNSEGYKIILRSQVVLSEGLLDFYIHEMSKYCIFKMFVEQWPKSPKYSNIMVPMDKVEEAINTLESKEWFFSYLNERYSRDVFLSCESMRDQLNLIGIDFTKVLLKAFPMEKEQTAIDFGKTVIEQMFCRRNEIAHQNDRSHTSAVQNDIDRAYVEDYMKNVEKIVNAIYELALEKDNTEIEDESKDHSDS